MRKVLITSLLVISLCSIGLAGDIPGDAPAPCTVNCPQAAPADEISITEIVTGLFALIF